MIIFNLSRSGLIFISSKGRNPVIPFSLIMCSIYGSATSVAPVLYQSDLTLYLGTPLFLGATALAVLNKIEHKFNKIGITNCHKLATNLF